MELGPIRERLAVAVENEAREQAENTASIGRLVHSETLLVELERDLELRDTSCNLIKNEAVSLNAEVLGVGRQLGSACVSAMRLNESLPLVIASVSKSVEK